MPAGRVKRNSNRKRSRVVYTRLFLSITLGTALVFLLVSFSSNSVTAISELKTEGETAGNADFNLQELYGARSSARVVRERNIATADGVGRIMENTPQGRLLGRRGALTDARRNLLILRMELLREHRAGRYNAEGHSVSGNIAGVRIHSERVVNNLYFLQVDIPLDKLMEGAIEIE